MMQDTHDTTHSDTLERISALLDGELEQSRLLEVIDRIADTEECRSFYRRSRALSGLVAAAEPTPAESAPEHVWQAIAEETGIEEVEAAVSGTTGERWTDRALRPVFRAFDALKNADHGPILATVAVLLALGGLTWIGLRDAGFSVEVTPATEPRLVPTDLITEIQIGSNEQMSDSRFIDLASEILQADQRYRRELLRLMSDIEQNIGQTPEGFGEQRGADRGEGSRSTEGLERDALEGPGSSVGVRSEVW